MRIAESLDTTAAFGGFLVLDRQRINYSFWFRYYLEYGDIMIELLQDPDDKDETIEQKFAIAAHWAELPEPQDEPL